MDHFQLITDSEDFNNPAGRGGRYAHPGYIPKSPLALRCWLHHNRPGTLPAHWGDIGIPAQHGQVLDVLFESGQTTSLLVSFVQGVQWLFLSLPHAPRQLVRVYHVKPTGKDILFPFNHVLWTDRAVAAELLDNTVHLWPRLINNRMDHITEPFRVVSLFLRDKGRIGIGLTPDFATANVSATPYKPRALHETNRHDPRRFVDLESMNPPVVLWGIENKTEDYAVLLQSRKPQTADSVDLWETTDTRYAGVRILRENPAGGDPMLWGLSRAVHGVPILDAVLSGDVLDAAQREILAPKPFGVQPFAASRMDTSWWCSRCLAETRGLDKVRSVEDGLCALHLRLVRGSETRTLTGVTCAASSSGRHKWSRTIGRLPVCMFCGTTKHSKVVLK